MILMLDNYDSFTYNLVQYLGEMGTELCIYRNDQLTMSQVRQLRPAGIVISPGPGRPENAGVSVPLVQEFAAEIPILGVCLGHQAVGLAFGGRINSASRLMHGKISHIHHEGLDLFAGVNNPFPATRYHSLIVERTDLPDALHITCESEDGTIMGLRHITYPVFGVQFHPESILTGEGKKILRNFLAICEPSQARES